jgi:hypothetical protein
MKNRQIKTWGKKVIIIIIIILLFGSLYRVLYFTRLDNSTIPSIIHIFIILYLHDHQVFNFMGQRHLTNNQGVLPHCGRK